jgi:glycosyltransferase involved in cell wall biosynthesis|tara:strand:+ start:324 stop:1439 length:1116 start_codon:yes stop_codon:yes gene_type:complete
LRKNKLLFLIGGYGTGGKERQLTEIIKGLPKEKYELHLFIKNDNSYYSYYFNSIKKNLTSYYNLDKQNFSLLDIFVLKKFVKFISPDVAFSFSTTLSHYSLLLKLLGGFHFRLINGSIRGAPVDLNFQMKFEKLMYNFYDEIVANSKAGLKAYRQRGKRGRYILYNGFNNYRLPKKSKIELRHQLGINDIFTVIMVASMGESKDQMSFIRSAARVLQNENDIQFFLIGDGPQKSEYINLVLSLGLNNQILFKGEVNNPEEYFVAADLSVLMSTNAEGFPNVVLESLACGTPVIANKEGGTNEILVDNFNGFLIDKNSYETLAMKILYLKNNHSTLHRLSRNGVKTVEKSFTTEKMKTTFNRIIAKEYSKML